ncbi:MAG TPA: TonB-dependent siderophore receptor [Fibrobacteraceae bacterium]|nr:TonB-dependent siderophore receptor [Fibrobacteraceae bacterium]
MAFSLFRSFFIATAGISIAWAQDSTAEQTVSLDSSVQLGGLEISAQKLLPKQGSVKSGYKIDTVSVGLLGETDLKDIPYTINAVSADYMANQQAQYVFDALRTNPSVTHSSGTNLVGGGASFIIRGYSSTTALIDGMPANSVVTIEDKERIEVMNGPAAFLYGFSSPGGTINYILKRPTETPLYAVNLGNFGGDQYYASGDVGGPLLQGRLGYRLNVMYQNKGEAGVKDQLHERDLVSGALDWNISPSAKWSFDYSRYYIGSNHGDNTVASIGKKVTAIPDAPKGSTNLMPSYSSSKNWTTNYGSSLKWRINDVFSLRTAARFSDAERYRHRAHITLINNEGDFTMRRNYYDTEWLMLQGNLFLDAKFATGALQHQVTLGGLGSQTVTKYAYPYASGNVSYGDTNNIYDVQEWPEDVENDTEGSPDKTTKKLWQNSGLLVDQIKIGDQWAVTVGGNVAHIDQVSWSYSSYATDGTVTANPEYQKTAFTPTAGLVFKATPRVSTYVSYTEGLEQGPTAPSSADNADETLDPYLTRQVEGGIKSQILDLNVNLAAFWMNTVSAYTDAGTNIYGEYGREVHKGVELAVNGKAGKYLTLGGGVTLLKAEVTEANADSLEGLKPTGVPEQVAKLFGELELPFLRGFFVNGAASYTGKEYVNTANTLSIPSVVVYDAGLRYVLPWHAHDVTLRAKVINVADEAYWASSGSSLNLGSPRTFSFSTSFKW